MKALPGIVPLVLTALFGWLLMEGHINFGSGEKDIFLLVPLLFWSLVFLVAYLVLWWRNAPLRRNVVMSTCIAVAVVVVTWLLLFVVFSPKIPQA
jgi:hypothetical protein